MFKKSNNNNNNNSKCIIWPSSSLCGAPRGCVCCPYVPHRWQKTALLVLQCLHWWPPWHSHHSKVGHHRSPSGWRRGRSLRSVRPTSTHSTLQQSYCQLRWTPKVSQLKSLPYRLLIISHTLHHDPKVLLLLLLNLLLTSNRWLFVFNGQFVTQDFEPFTHSQLLLIKDLILLRCRCFIILQILILLFIIIWVLSNIKGLGLVTMAHKYFAHIIFWLAFPSCKCF